MTVSIKGVLIHPNPESALNQEAARLILENYEGGCCWPSLLTKIHGRVHAGGTRSQGAEATGYLDLAPPHTPRPVILKPKNKTKSLPC